MKMRVAGIAAVSVLLCGFVATQAPKIGMDKPAVEEEVVTAQLKPTMETVIWEPEQAVGTSRGSEQSELLLPAADYGSIFPYAAAIVGWEQDGTPVYRYAMADAAGELLTKPIYTSVTREACGDSFVWLMHDSKDGTARTACAARDGSWAIGPFVGSVTIQDSYICVKRADSDVTLLYNADGKVIGQVNGEVVSCADGVVVSRTIGDDATTWYLSSSETAKQITSISAYSVSAFSGGIASVQLSETEWGLIDTEGVLTNTAATWQDESCDGYVLAQDDAGNYGVLSADGETAVPFSYMRGVRCGEEHPLYQLWTDDETCEVISAAKGQKMVLPQDLQGQQLKALPDNYFAYTDADGNTVVFDDLKRVTLEGTAALYQQGDFLIAQEADGYQIFSMEDRKASAQISSYRYVAPTQQAAATDTVFTVIDAETGLQGIGNVNGRLVLRAEYDSIVSMDGTYFAAMRDGWSGIVDADGKWVVCTRIAGVNEQGGADDEVE